jgi:hypothetical protein
LRCAAPDCAWAIALATVAIAGIAPSCIVSTAVEGAMLTTLTQWYSPAEILRMATSVNAELLGMSGPRNPYPGKLGVVEEGALADLILVDGDPIADLKLIADPDTHHEGWALRQERALRSKPTSLTGFGRVGVWRGGVRLSISVCRPFRLAVP